MLRPTMQSRDGSGQQLLKVVAVVAGALVILWGSYLFRYSETPGGQESFNRPLVDKMNDVVTPMYHTVLVTMAATHVVPRAYIWGFADTIHAGMEGRSFPQLIFGRQYIRKGPKYFFPAMIALKLPIGLTILVVLGLFVFVTRRLFSAWNLAAGIVFAAAISFLLVLTLGATYAPQFRWCDPGNISTNLWEERTVPTNILAMKGLTWASAPGKLLISITAL
jgi:hypothetical protein